MGYLVKASNRGTEGIVVVGPLPPPHGGVSTFVERLGLAVPSIVRMILDTGVRSVTPKASRFDARVDVRLLPVRPVRRWRALRRHLRDVPPGTTVVVNVSHPQGVLRHLPAFLAGLPIAVVLHHGMPFGRRGPVGWVLELATRLVLRTGTDIVVCLNEAQARFVREAYGMPETSLRFASSYVPVNLVLEDIGEVRSGRDRPRVVASGEPRAYHHFDRLVEVWEAFGFGDEADLVICLYGPEDSALESELAAAAAGTEAVRLLRDLDGWEFLDLLRASDVYVRTSSVDAFGIAVADAVRLGLEVVATDVCVRYPGCRLIPPNDIPALAEALGNAIRARRSAEARPLPVTAGATEISFLDALEIDYRTAVTSGKEGET